MKVVNMNENDISQEHFISEHYFVYVVKGIMNLYDGNEYQSLKLGEGCIARKNRLGRFNKIKVNNELEKLIIALDEKFLRMFQEKHKKVTTKFNLADTFIKLKPNKLMPEFIHSLKQYYDHGIINEPFADLKREELLIILLQNQPELAGVLFDYGIPEKINLEEFMNRNFKFNVSMQRFAYLTGRSLSAFKRDFKIIFNETPGRWLVQKRLEEAYFLLDKKDKKPSDFYLDLGFEALSHFSFAFKKLFRLTPTELIEQKKNNIR
jgi:AraC family transcriptional regulator, exoenzyme S synthesis regulatory protein ExsA